MNNLNSTLIEGVLKDNAQLHKTSNGTNVCRIIIESNRAYQVEGKIHEVVSHLSVEVSGSLAEVVCVKGIKGRGVRVVGWLKEERCIGDDKKPQSKIVIVAEHVEFRPEQNTGSETVVKKAEQKKRRRGNYET